MSSENQEFSDTLLDDPLNLNSNNLFAKRFENSLRHVQWDALIICVVHVQQFLRNLHDNTKFHYFSVQVIEATGLNTPPHHDSQDLYDDSVNKYHVLLKIC